MTYATKINGEYFCWYILLHRSRLQNNHYWISAMQCRFKYPRTYLLLCTIKSLQDNSGIITFDWTVRLGCPGKCIWCLGRAVLVISNTCDDSWQFFQQTDIWGVACRHVTRWNKWTTKTCRFLYLQESKRENVSANNYAVYSISCSLLTWVLTTHPLSCPRYEIHKNNLTHHNNNNNNNIYKVPGIIKHES
jgi:hypothetical protein